MTRVKIEFLNNIHVLPKFPESFSELKLLVKQTLNYVEGFPEDIQFFYFDEEKDQIMLQCENDLEALRNMDLKQVKIQVQERQIYSMYQSKIQDKDPNLIINGQMEQLCQLMKNSQNSMQQASNDLQQYSNIMQNSQSFIQNDHNNQIKCDFYKNTIEKNQQNNFNDLLNSTNNIPDQMIDIEQKMDQLDIESQHEKQDIQDNVEIKYEEIPKKIHKQKKDKKIQKQKMISKMVRDSLTNAIPSIMEQVRNNTDNQQQDIKVEQDQQSSNNLKQEFGIELEQQAYQEKQLTDRQAKQQQIIHDRVQCDLCGVLPIQGIRYKCTVCKDFDLCQKCEASNCMQEHEHVFLKIRDPSQAPNVMLTVIRD